MIEDPELYYAWLQAHQKLTDSFLGPAHLVFDKKTGVCLRIEYHNPDLEGQEERRRFWRAVWTLQATYQEDP